MGQPSIGNVGKNINLHHISKRRPAGYYRRKALSAFSRKAPLPRQPPGPAPAEQKAGCVICGASKTTLHDWHGKYICENCKKKYEIVREHHA